ncbi:MAG TPA: class I adenylate-forming enzyme family protein [Magnetospirillaceae bacterium]
MLSDAPIRSFLADFEALVARDPEAPACVDENSTILSYGAFDDLIDRMLAYINGLGLGKGSTLLALMPNAVETALVFLACLKGGLRFAPLPCTASAAEITSAANLTGAQFILIADPVPNRVVQQLALLTVPIRRIETGTDLSWIPADKPKSKPGAGQLIITTSGSTGAAKAILIDGDRLWSSGHAFMDFHGLIGARCRFWNYLPMSYLGGLFNLCLIPLVTGGSFVIGEAFSGKTMLSFWDTVVRFDIDSLWMVPAIVRGLTSLADRAGKPKRTPPIKICFLGTAPIRLAEKTKFRDLFGIEMLENFALSETTFLTSEVATTQRVESGTGAILPYIQMKLLPVERDDDGRATDSSEIAVKSPFMMLGYMTEGGKVDATLDVEGFLRTGDLGKFEQGQLVITGRTKDIVKKGGYLILLPEVEHLAAAHPDVQEAVAVPCAHPFFGESYILFVRLNNDTGDAAAESSALAEIRGWVQDGLARHKWPERIQLHREFPRTRSGKIMKHALAAEITAAASS